MTTPKDPHPMDAVAPASATRLQNMQESMGAKFGSATPLKGAPVEATPLTEEQIIDATEHIDTSRNGYFVHIARAIEHAHGIHAALAAPSAEKEQT